MVWTTPKKRKDEHKTWHKFRRGGCLYCGFHCEDCPIGVATCKCDANPKMHGYGR